MKAAPPESVRVAHSEDCTNKFFVSGQELTGFCFISLMMFLNLILDSAVDRALIQVFRYTETGSVMAWGQGLVWTQGQGLPRHRV